MSPPCEWPYRQCNRQRAWAESYLHTFSILFSYYFAFMKVYALCTLHETGWGTRVGVDEPEKAQKAGEEAGLHDQFEPTITSSPGPQPQYHRNHAHSRRGDDEAMEMKPVAL